jgi:hypothetical protein
MSGKQLLVAYAILMPAASAVGASQSDFKINSDAGVAYQGYSACATARDGSFAVVWEDARNGGNDIYLQRFDAAGGRLGDNYRVNDTALPEQYAPAIAIDPTGEVWIVWQDFRTSGYPTNGDIFMQRIDAEGAAFGPNIKVNTDGGVVTQKEPAIAIGEVEVLILWSDLRRGEWDIYAQRFDHGGNPLGTNYRLNDETTPAPQHAPQACVLSDGRFAVVWYDTRNGNEDIFLQLITASGGAKLGANVRVNSGGDVARQLFPTVAPGPLDGFTVAWQDFRMGTYPAGGRIFSQYFDNASVPTGANTLLADSPNDQRTPRLTGDGFGNRVAAWEELRDGVWSVYERKFVTTSDTGLAITAVGSDTANATRARPQVAIGSGRIFFTWSDLRVGNFDIYMAIESYRFPTFAIRPSTISFAVPAHAPETVPPASVTVSAIGPGTLDIDWQSVPEWLSVSPLSASTPANFTISVQSPLPAADTTVTLFAADLVDTAAREPLLVRFDLIEPILVATPASVSLDLPVEGSDSVLVRVTNGNPGPLAWTFTAPGAPWSTTVTGSDSLWVHFDGTGLSGAQVDDTVWLIDPLAANSPLAVPLSAHVAGIPPTPPFLIASPAVLAWMTQAGSATSDSIAMALSANVDTAIAWTVTYSPAWCSLSKSAGVIPDTIILRAVTDTLALGYYVDSVEIWSPDASNAPLRVPMVMIVDAVSSVGGGEDESGSDFSIYPNPFNSSVLISWPDRRSAPGAIRIVDLLGRRVADFKIEPATSSELRWNPSPEVPSGVYFLRLERQSGAAVHKLLYLK